MKPCKSKLIALYLAAFVGSLAFATNDASRKEDKARKDARAACLKEKADLTGKELEACILKKLEAAKAGHDKSGH